MYERQDQRSNFDDIGHFHHKFGLPSVTHDGAGHRELEPELLGFRVKFLLEELKEFFTAVGWEIDIFDVYPTGKPKDYVKAFDSLLDLVVVAMGTAHLMGFPWQSGWTAVQLANMAKIRSESKDNSSERGSSWDIVKPEGWVSPDETLAKMLAMMGWDIPASEGTK